MAVSTALVPVGDDLKVDRARDKIRGGIQQLLDILQWLESLVRERVHGSVAA